MFLSKYRYKRENGEEDLFKKALCERQLRNDAEALIFVCLKGEISYDRYLSLCKKYRINPVSNEEMFEAWYKSTEKYIGEKIKSACTEFSLSEKELLKKIKHDPLYRRYLAKDANRQGIQEITAADIIKTSLPFIKNFETKPKGGKNALYPFRGKVLTKKESKDKGTCKSVDFTFNYEFGGKTLRFYCTHKYINEPGGAQDNQYIDVMTFLRHSNMSTDNDTHFIAIVDGDYFDTNHSFQDSSGRTKFQYLCDRYVSDNVSVIRSEGIMNIATVCADWVYKNFPESDEVLDEINYLYNLKLR